MNTDYLRHNDDRVWESVFGFVLAHISGQEILCQLFAPPKEKPPTPKRETGSEAGALEPTTERTLAP